MITGHTLCCHPERSFGFARDDSPCLINPDQGDRGRAIAQGDRFFLEPWLHVPAAEDLRLNATPAQLADDGAGRLRVMPDVAEQSWIAEEKAHQIP